MIRGRVGPVARCDRMSQPCICEWVAIASERQPVKMACRFPLPGVESTSAALRIATGQAVAPSVPSRAMHSSSPLPYRLRRTLLSLACTLAATTLASTMFSFKGKA